MNCPTRFYKSEIIRLQWCRNERNGVSNHRRLDCLRNRLFGRGSKKYLSTASLAFMRGIHRWPLTKGQWRGSDSIWWCHHYIVAIWYKAHQNEKTYLVSHKPCKSVYHQKKTCFIIEHNIHYCNEESVQTVELYCAPSRLWIQHNTMTS